MRKDEPELRTALIELWEALIAAWRIRELAEWLNNLLMGWSRRRQVIMTIASFVLAAAAVVAAYQ